MSTREIIQEIKSLPFDQRLTVIEKAIKTLYESKEVQLEKAAKALLRDYKTDKNLTVFTSLDIEKFYEAR